MWIATSNAGHTTLTERAPFLSAVGRKPLHKPALLVGVWRVGPTCVPQQRPKDGQQVEGIDTSVSCSKLTTAKYSSKLGDASLQRGASRCGVLWIHIDLDRWVGVKLLSRARLDTFRPEVCTTVAHAVRGVVRTLESRCLVAKSKFLLVRHCCSIAG